MWQLHKTVSIANSRRVRCDARSREPQDSVRGMLKAISLFYPQCKGNVRGRIAVQTVPLQPQTLRSLTLEVTKEGVPFKEHGNLKEDLLFLEIYLLFLKRWLVEHLLVKISPVIMGIFIYTLQVQNQRFLNYSIYTTGLASYCS